MEGAEGGCAELFKLMNEVESEDLVFTLETIVDKFGEEMAPFAMGLVTNLVCPGQAQQADWQYKMMILSICQYVNMPICQYANMSIRQYVNMSICQYVNMSICQYVNTSICQYVNMSICQYVNMSICQYANM